jgi:hypothetical protein
VESQREDFEPYFAFVRVAYVPALSPMGFLNQIFLGWINPVRVRDAPSAFHKTFSMRINQLGKQKLAGRPSQSLKAQRLSTSFERLSRSHRG